MITSSDSNVDIGIVLPGDLTPDDIALWSSFQQADPNCHSPFFRPEFMQIVASVRCDVEVAVLRRGGEAVGFFPFHRMAGNVGYPIGESASDFHGVIARRDVTFTAEQLIRGCRLAAWHFNHLIASQETFRPYHQLLAESPYIELTNGYEGFREEKRLKGTDLFRKSDRKSRVLQREVGPLRFEMASTDAKVLEKLFEWKRTQYRRIKSVDHLAAPWQRALFDAAWRHHGELFAGKLCVLYAGDHVVAISLAIQSGAVLHSWCSSYDQRFAKYSPGTIQRLERLKACESLGIRRIDLGRGPEDYKKRFSTGSSLVAEGSVDFRLLAGPLRRARTYAREIVRASPLRGPVQRVVRGIRSWTVYR